MSTTTPPTLKRTIGLPTVVSTSAGLTFASSTFLVVVQICYYLAGDSAWLAIGIAGGLCALAAAAFSELNGMWPSVNGIRLYLHKAFGEKVALIASLTYMSVVTLVVGTEAYVLSHVLTAAVPTIAPPVWIFLMLTLATAINFRGLKIAGAFQSIVSFSVIASIVAFSIVSLSHAHFVIPRPLQTGGIGPLFQAVGVAIFLFVGFEWVTPLADEVRKPRDIPTGMFIALAGLVIVYGLVSVAMFSHLAPGGRDTLFGTLSHRNPVPHLTFARTEFGTFGWACMIAVSLCMSLTTFNAGLMGVSRFLYGMARDSVLPRPLASLSVRFSTPDRAVLAVYVIALIVSALVYWTQRFVLLVNLAAATEAFIYAAAALSVVSLRRRDPDKPRPFQMRGGVALPLVTALLFAGVGIGVFAQPGPEYWGAGLLLLLIGLSWAAYIHWFALPRLAKIRAEASARVSRRPSRRPAPVSESEPIGPGRNQDTSGE